jgi:hypothetical protein
MPQPERKIFENRMQQAIGLIWKSMGWHPEDAALDSLKKSDMPFPPSKEQKMAWEIYDHITANRRSIRDEYNLIQQKKSTLSKRLRDFVVELIEIYEEEKTN